MVRQAKRQFIIMYTECGSAEQLVKVGDEPIFSTIKDAQARVKELVGSKDYDFTANTMVVAEIVAVGRPTGMEWMAKPKLED